MQHTFMIPTVLVGFIVASANVAPLPSPADSPARPDPHALLDQPLAPIEGTCEAIGAVQVRHVRSATLDAAGQIADRIEARTVMEGATRRTDYLVNDVHVFTDRAGTPELTAAGAVLLSDPTPHASTLLAAFAAMEARAFAADAAPFCGVPRDKAGSQAKCALIGVVGCFPPAAGLTCGVSALIAVGCAWLVEKTCEAEPDTCQPGWTEG